MKGARASFVESLDDARHALGVIEQNEGFSRELSLVRTKLDEAQLWWGQYLRRMEAKA